MYILENKQDGSMLFAKSYSETRNWETAPAAKAALTRASKKFDFINKEDYVVSAYADYNEPEVTITKRLPGTGEMSTYSIGINSVGTCTDPSTETYWSM